jgi:ABC-type multidrug transport system fused ATPase/permease subunit
MMLIGALFEVVGIGLILPILVIMTQSNFIERYPMLQPWWEMLGRPSHLDMIVMGMGTLVAVYALKVVFLTFVAWRQSRFVFGLQASLSKSLFVGYLAQPYTFHLQHNSAQLTRNIMAEVTMFVNMVMLPTLQLATDGLVLAGVLILLMSIEPAGALGAFAVMGGAGFLFQHVTRGPLKRWGKARQYNEGKRLQHLQQGFGGVKEIKLLGREAELFSQFEVYNLGTARVVHRQNVLRQMPRLWFEMLAICGLTILVIVMLLIGTAPASLLPTLGLFAAAAFRLMISANRILGAIQSIRYSNSVIHTLDEAFHLFESTAPLDAEPLVQPFKDSIELRQVNYRYPGAPRDSLSTVDIRIPWRSTVGFIGGSGAGKTTLVDLVLGLLEPTAGSVCVDGVDIHSNLRGWQSQIGYVPQSIYLADDTLRRNIAYCIPNPDISEEAVWSAVRAAQLEELVSQLPQGLDTLVGEQGVRLSGGQRQRIGIARALYHDPAVLVLDEATSALDSETEGEVMKSIVALRGEKTVLIIAHRLSTIEHCDSLYELKDGQLIAFGSTAQVLSDRRSKNCDG